MINPQSAIRNPRWIVVAVLAAAMLIAESSEAQWASVGAMRPAGRSSTLTFRDSRSIVTISAITPDIIRVRFSPTRELGRDYSYAVLPLASSATAPVITVDR